MTRALDLNTAPVQSIGQHVPANDAGDFERRKAGLRERLSEPHHAATVVRLLYPHADLRGGNARLGNVAGDHGESLSIALTGDNCGQWIDHATAEGGDLIRLWEAREGVGFMAAVEALEDVVGVSRGDPRGFVRKARERGERTARAAGPKPELVRHDPPLVWVYTDRDGQPVARVERLWKRNPVTGERLPGKSFSQATWDGSAWVPRAMAEGRPLYNLPGVLAASVVVICEGEKVADRVMALGLEGLAATTALGGANAKVEATDWEPLRGRGVLLARDNDAPGEAWAAALSPVLGRLGCRVAVVSIPAGLPPKWDLADADDATARALLADAAASLPETPEAANAEPDAYDIPTFTGDLPPPRAWVWGDFLMAKAVSAIAAPPGVGKTTFSFQVAIAVAFGLDFGPWGPAPGGGGKVLLINGEEPQDELARRFLGACAEMGVSPLVAAERVSFVSGMDDGEGRFKLVTLDAATGVPVWTAGVERLRRTVRRGGFGVVMADPLIEFMDCEETNSAQKAVGAALRSVAVSEGCAVLAFHHTPKAANGDTAAGDMNALRGGGSLAGVARFVLTMFNMSAREADRLGVPAERRAKLMRVDSAKASMAPGGGSAAWFERVGVDLGNANGDRPSDWVGVLRPARLEGKAPAEGETGALPSEGEQAMLRIANEAARLCSREGRFAPSAAVSVTDLVRALGQVGVGLGKHKITALLKTAGNRIATDEGNLVFTDEKRGSAPVRRVHFEPSA